MSWSAESHFSSEVPRLQKESYDYPMHVVARCTSAAPAMSLRKKVSTGNRDDYYALINEGVFANNPAACAYVEDKSELRIRATSRLFRWNRYSRLPVCSRRLICGALHNGRAHCSGLCWTGWPAQSITSYSSFFRSEVTEPAGISGCKRNCRRRMPEWILYDAGTCGSFV